MLRISLLCIYFLGALVSAIMAQSPYGNEPLAHTYSIVARDPDTGEMGVAVQSHWFSVGSLVTWGEAGVGVVATQSFVNPAYGPQGLALMKTGLSAEQSLKALLAGDEGREVRQVAMLDVKGNVATHTGANCIQAAGHFVGDNFSVQANLMDNDKVWPAMAEAFEKAEGPLAERMVAALAAAQAVGGDIRGKQSAAILVVKGESSGQVWADKVVDLRIEDHPEPIKELQRLMRVHRAYEHMNAGDLAIEEKNEDKALAEYAAAEEMFPDNLEMQYWHAVSLVNIGQLKNALPMFQAIFRKDENWRELTPRLIPVGLLTVTEEELAQIMKLK
ncbi:MAG: DUF1028 domain-containing protein [Bacteroidia bacterium]